MLKLRGAPGRREVLEGLEEESNTGEAPCNFNILFPCSVFPRGNILGIFREKSGVCAPALVAFKPWTDLE